MWPFKPRKRFVIMSVNDATYYTGVSRRGRALGTVAWAYDIENAMHFDRDSADRVVKATIISDIGGTAYGPMAVIED